MDFLVDFRRHGDCLVSMDDRAAETYSTNTRGPHPWSPRGQPPGAAVLAVIRENSMARAISSASAIRATSAVFAAFCIVIVVVVVIIVVVFVLGQIHR